MEHEERRNDDPMWSACVIVDENGNYHIYNPSITIEEFRKKGKKNE